jgi:hypothetical protein
MMADIVDRCGQSCGEISNAGDGSARHQSFITLKVQDRLRSLRPR